MSIIYKIIIVLGLAIGIFLGGYYTGKGDKEVQTQEKVVYKEGEQKIVYQDRIVTVTKVVHPDGTTEETTKTEDKNQTTDTRTAEGQTDKKQDTKVALSNYSIGTRYWASFQSPLETSYGNIEINAGRRIIGDVWADIGVKKDAASVGIRIQF
jgi:hypothetical protein